MGTNKLLTVRDCTHRYAEIENRVTFNRSRHTATIRCYVVYAWSERHYAYRLRTSRLPDDVLKSLETETGVREFLRNCPEKYDIVACPDMSMNVQNDYNYYLNK